MKRQYVAYENNIKFYNLYHIEAWRLEKNENDTTQYLIKSFCFLKYLLKFLDEYIIFYLNSK